MGLTSWFVVAVSLMPQSSDVPPSHSPPGLVVRISKAWIAERFEQILPAEFDVSTNLAQGRITGHATNQGQAQVRLDSSGSQPALILTYQGTARARLTGQTGSLAMHGHSTTQFVAQQRIAFDGSQFLAGHTTLTARTSLTIDDVSSSRRGVVGNLVERVGSRTLARNKSQTDAEVGSYAQSCLKNAFNAAADQLLLSLNETTCIECCLKPLYPGFSTWSVHLTESDEHLLLCFAPGDAPTPDLPVATEQTPAVEIWLQVPDYQSRMIAVLASSNRACSWLGWLAGERYAMLAHLSKTAEVTYQGRWTRIASGRPAARSEMQR